MPQNHGSHSGVGFKVQYGILSSVLRKEEVGSSPGVTGALAYCQSTKASEASIDSRHAPGGCCDSRGGYRLRMSGRGDTGKEGALILLWGYGD